MSRLPPRSTRADSRCPYTARFRYEIVECTKQFLGIGARRGKALLQIDRLLLVRDTVHGAVEKQRLTPVFGMTSELHRYRHRSQMEFAEDQSVEQFAGRTAVVTLGVVAVFTTLIAGNLRQRRIRIDRKSGV